MSFAKAIATNNPRGVNYVAETDFYYPIFSSVAELFPKNKNPIAVATTPTTTTPAPILVNPKFDSIAGTYVDSSNFWRRKVRINTRAIQVYFVSIFAI